MTLRSLIADDSTAVFLDTDEFAESVTYYPWDEPGATARSDRSISAVVIREPIEYEDENELPVKVFEVHVDNDSTTGISSDEINLGRDQIGFPLRDGESASTLTIIRMPTQDHGMLVLHCRE